MRFVLVPALLLFVTGCVEPSVRFFVGIDEERQHFDDGVKAEGITQGGTFIVRITGSSDPIPRAIDDESAIVLELDLDRVGLGNLPRNQPIPVNGITSVTPRDDSGDIPDSFTPREGHEPAITGLLLLRSCFCPPPQQALMQSFEGTLQLADLPDGKLEVALDLAMTGGIPYGKTASDTRTTIDARVEVEAP